VVGGVYIASRQQTAHRSALAQGKGLPALEEDDEDNYAAVEVPTAREVRRHSSPQPVVQRASSSSMLLEGLKEEIFQLEVEHKQGHISQQEYEKTKAALDQTLQRALKREASRQV
jgi:hypothetical protein